jgi:hypothetical protein
MRRRIFRVAPGRRSRSVSFLLLFALAGGTRLPAQTADAPARGDVTAAATAVSAAQNLAVDPSGRVVDVTFDQDVTASAPAERFRFDIDIVQPLARDGSANLGDLTGDGVADLLLTTWSGEATFFPGVAGQPAQFGAGQWLRHTVSSPSENPFFFGNGNWIVGGIADLDGDGHNDVVIAHDIYTNVGTPSAPLLRKDFFLTGGGGEFDPAASVGDLNGDGKPDIVGNFDQLYIYFNTSTPGSYSFTRQTLGSRRNVYLAGDLNGDGKTDLVSTAGIYFNQGTAQTPSFDFNNPTPWVVSGGPSWGGTGDQPVRFSARDADGDGRLDLYVSNLQSTVWQTLYYHNVGTAQSPSFQYVGPVTAASSPVNMFYRDDSTPNITGTRAYVADGDIDQNGMTEVLLSTDGGSVTGNPTMLWSFPAEAGPAGARTVSYQDLYTFPALDKVDHECGGSHFSPDPLCKPPDLFSAWKDLNGDGLPDVLRMDTFSSANFPAFRRARTGASIPFTLAADAALQTPSSGQVAGYGAAFVDVNLDGHPDLVTGADDGTLRYYRNTATDGSFAPADPVPLTDSGGTPVDVGSKSWPTAIDLDGDGDLDLLVGENGGAIRKVMCVAPGGEHGYALGALLSTPQQDPVNLNEVVGGGLLTPSLTTIDADGDGLKDIVMGDNQGLVWLLKNTGTPSAASFSLGPLSVSRTAAAYMEFVNPRKVRLRFALPVTVGRTRLAFHNVPTAGGAASGELTVAAAPPPSYGSLQFSSAAYSVNENDGQATINVTRAGGSDEVVSVHYATSDGTASSSFDYGATSGTLTFNDSETSKSFTVPITNDTAQEPDETVNLTLSSPAGGATLGAPSTAVLTILANDAPPNVTINDVTVTEGNSGTTNAVFTVSLSTPSDLSVQVAYATADGTATSGNDYTNTSGALQFPPGVTTKQISVPVLGDTLDEPDETFFVNLSNAVNANITDSQGKCTILNDDARLIQLSSAAFSVGEADGSVAVTVTRAGDTSGAASVNYATSDGTASERSDYAATVGTLRFAAGEASKTITVFVTNDVYVEPAETFAVTLSNPQGAALGSPSAATVTINSDDTVPPTPAANPAGDPQFFVRQHYRDFLGREADTSGLNFWTGGITSCGSDANCVEVKRVDTSAAFFLSIEFQGTGYLVYKMYKAGFGNLQNKPVAVQRASFLADTRQIQSTPNQVIVGQRNWQQQLEDNKNAFALDFVQRPAFQAAHGSQGAAAFVDSLFASAGVTPTTAERQTAINLFGGGGTSNEAAALRNVAESNSASSKLFNEAFVLMQYFGYLQRNPDDAPDGNFSGYNFWLSKLNQFNGNYVQAEMVRAFIESTEYRGRFGPP